MKPVLLLSTRGEDAAAHAEQLSFARAASIAPAYLHQLRVEKLRTAQLEAWAHTDLSAFSAIIVGGGPFNASDPNKSEHQLEIEAFFDQLIAQVLSQQIPFFGACYGVGLLGAASNATISDKYGEAAAVVDITLTDAGLSDPVLRGLPTTFPGIVGHKEAIEVLPNHAAGYDIDVLASGAHCPVQMFRMGSKAYATQFHPELDADTFKQRLDIYADRGYFVAGGDRKAVAQARQRPVHLAGAMLKNFIELARTES